MISNRRMCKGSTLFHSKGFCVRWRRGCCFSKGCDLQEPYACEHIKGFEKTKCFIWFNPEFLRRIPMEHFCGPGSLQHSLIKGKALDSQSSQAGIVISCLACDWARHFPSIRASITSCQCRPSALCQYILWILLAGASGAIMSLTVL